MGGDNDEGPIELGLDFAGAARRIERRRDLM